MLDSPEQKWPKRPKKDPKISTGKNLLQKPAFMLFFGILKMCDRRARHVTEQGLKHGKQSPRGNTGIQRGIP